MRIPRNHQSAEKKILGTEISENSEIKINIETMMVKKNWNDICLPRKVILDLRKQRILQDLKL